MSTPTLEIQTQSISVEESTDPNVDLELTVTSVTTEVIPGSVTVEVVVSSSGTDVSTQPSVEVSAPVILVEPGVSPVDLELYQEYLPVVIETPYYDVLEVELGMPGPQGIQGQQGIQGDKGDKGDTGNTGAPGSDSPRGVFVGTTAPVGAVAPYLFFHDLGDGTYDMLLEIP